jgi:N-acetyl-gamma-glutamylphosphate reductase
MTVERKVPSMSEPEVISSHIHNAAHVMKHYAAGGHTHEKEKYKKHAAGHTLFTDHVQKMARGGKC